MTDRITLVECPRDAMQGLADFVPTSLKIKYLQKLIDANVDVLDFGSFVSPQAIPQMRDTAQVLEQLRLDHSQTRLLAIIANVRGAEAAIAKEAISYVGFPFSISETFQMRNTNASIGESFEKVKVIQDLCLRTGKRLVVYLSMDFGNHYGDPWNAEIALEWVSLLNELGIRTIALSDTVGIAHPESIRYLFSHLVPVYPEMEFGAHFHTRPEVWEEKIVAAFETGCRRFDGAIKGYGGCPMAKDELTGNMPTEKIVEYFLPRKMLPGIRSEAFLSAIAFSAEIFDHYH